MEPFEISLTFIRVQGWEKKIAWEFFFVCSQEKSPWEWRKKEKKKNQATLSNMWVSFY